MGDRVCAFVIAAIDQEPSRTGRPHFPEGDFLFTHALLKRGRDASGKPLGIAPWFGIWHQVLHRIQSSDLERIQVGTD